MGLREQFGDFIGPPSKKRDPKPPRREREPKPGGRSRRRPEPQESRRPDGELPRVNDTEHIRCDVCGKVTMFRCFKLSKGRGEKGSPMRLLEIMVHRDLHEGVMRARFSAQVDDAQYVAFWLCTDSGHTAREMGEAA